MAKTERNTREGFDKILLYTTPNGAVKVEIYLQNETVWLTQQKIARLFGVQRPAITKHLKNIFASGELIEDEVSSILEHATQHGAIKGKSQTSKTKFYNLDAIISVGYRVNSSQAMAFRIWATERLKEYIIKGFTMDDERLKNPNNIFGKDYFEEQLARIRDVRSSERRFYQKITDIYAQCSADYNVDSETTKKRRKIMGNEKLTMENGTLIPQMKQIIADKNPCQSAQSVSPVFYNKITENE